VIFDRSWYNRGGVEPVMGFCTSEEHHEFLREVPEFEKMLVKSGIKFFKFYFSVSKDEQGKRFEERKLDPLKQYKLSPVDELAQDLWDKYTVAKFSMLMASHTDVTPWTIVRSDDKKKARLETMKYILKHLDYNKKIKIWFKKDKKIIINGLRRLLYGTRKYISREGIKKMNLKDFDKNGDSWTLYIKRGACLMVKNMLHDFNKIQKDM
jgi:polyphosphate kinase